MNWYRHALLALVILLHCISAASAGEKRYPTGVTDTEIKVGQTMPYSGPLSLAGTIGRAETAYFMMINERGGVNGRKIALISFDDGYAPPKTLEQTRRLVEQDGVTFIFSSIGTPTNATIQKYLNDRKVPQLLVTTGATRFADPENYPWTMPMLPSFRTEGRIVAKYILEHRSSAKIAVLYLNDDTGRDYLKGVKDVLGDKAASMIVKEASFELTDPTIDSQVVTLQASGADTFIDIAPAKAAAQAIRKVRAIGWKPAYFLASVAASIEATFKPAGIENSVGLVSALWLKDPNDPQWAEDPGLRDWLAWMKQWYPEGDLKDVYNVYPYTAAQALVRVLQQCGDNLSRENIMRQAANLHDIELPMLLPGIRINTSRTDFNPIKQMRLAKFDGQHWVLFGDLLDGR
jgi:branched-chain amino acid transport system substrate-binding protein